MTIVADLILLLNKLKGIFSVFSKVWDGITWAIDKINFLKKTAEVIEDVVPKATFTQKVKNIIFPRAKLTYWIADEEVIVYVSKFTQKDKFKLMYTEIETGRQVMVNSAQPINYRLEELKASDIIQPTEIQQNQHY